MIIKFIKNNINYLNSYLVRGILYAKNINVTSEEAKHICYAIKNNLDDLLNKNYKSSLNYLYDKVNKESLDEILNLYTSISNKYL